MSKPDERVDVPEWVKSPIQELMRNFRVQSIPPATFEDWYRRLGDLGSTSADVEKAAQKLLHDTNQRTFPTWAEFARYLPRRGSQEREYPGVWSIEGTCSLRVDGEIRTDVETVFQGVPYDRREKIVGYVLAHPLGNEDHSAPTHRRKPNVHTPQQVHFVNALIPGSYEGWLELQRLEAASAKAA